MLCDLVSTRPKLLRRHRWSFECLFESLALLNRSMLKAMKVFHVESNEYHQVVTEKLNTGLQIIGIDLLAVYCVYFIKQFSEIEILI